MYPGKIRGTWSLELGTSKFHTGIADKLMKRRNFLFSVQPRSAHIQLFFGHFKSRSATIYHIFYHNSAQSHSYATTKYKTSLSIRTSSMDHNWIFAPLSCSSKTKCAVAGRIIVCRLESQTFPSSITLVLVEISSVFQWNNLKRNFAVFQLAYFSDCLKKFKFYFINQKANLNYL